MNLVTNGMLFDRKKIIDILSSNVNFGDYVTFSILGDSHEVHETVMRGIDHERVIHNVLDFVELRKKHGTNGPTIETIFYAMPENVHELQQYVKRWKGIVDHVKKVPSISNSFAAYKKGLNDDIPLRQNTCMNIWERMTVYWNGDVTMCCEDIDGNYVVGNLAEKTIKEIWNSRELLSFRALHKEKRFGEIALCKRCDMFTP